MALYRVTAEHTAGASVSHPCTRGIYEDPTDVFDQTVEAPTPEDAERIGFAMLMERAERAQPCNCKRHLSPGGNRWAESVAVVAEPENA